MTRARGKLARSILAVLLAGAAESALSGGAAAQTTRGAPDAPDANALNAAGLQQHVAFDIAPQPLSSAILEFARQAGLRTPIYAYDDLAGLETRGLRGSYPPDRGLELLLAGTGFEGRVGAGNVLELKADPRPQGGGAEHSAGARASAASDAQAGLVAPLTQLARSGPIEDAITITGTRIRGGAPAGANVMVLDRSHIDESGRSTLLDVLHTLPQVFPGSQNEVTQNYTASPGSNIAFGSTVDLRGLGADATLTLINGRRLAPAGFGNFVDVSAIPLAAVARVEVLADGASATYGSDAIGGVVNIVLRDDLDGAETALRFGGVSDGGLGEHGFSHVFGQSWAGGRFIAGYEFRSRDGLSAADRPFSADTDLRPLGGSNFSRNLANPGNITRVGATAVTLAIPRNQDGTSLSQGELLAGQVNLENGNRYADLIPEQSSHSLFGSVRFDLSDRLELFADLLATRREAQARDNQLTATLTVPQSNAYRQLNNLFPGAGNLTIAYSFAGDLGPVRYSTASDTLSLSAGAGYDFDNDWRAEAALSYGRHVDDVLFDNAADTSQLAALLGSSSLATAFNPFADGGNSSDAVLAALRRSQITDTQSELTAISLKADGPLLDLPGGPLRVALGAEQRLEAFEVTRRNISSAGLVAVQDTQAPGERTTDALFLEVLAPLIGEETNVPLVHRLNLSLSVRREHSGEYGSATTPKIGLGWSLTPALHLRATWGTSFKAPRFDQTRTGISAAYAVASRAIDPFATNGTTGLLQVFGGNPDLEPEEAEVWTAGFDYRPTWLSRLDLSATYYDIDFANRIAIAGDILTAIRNPTAFGANLFRNPDASVLAFYRSLDSTISGVEPPEGVELIWDGRLSNVSSQRVRGVDLGAAYAFPVGAGELSLAFTAGAVLEFNQRTNAAFPGLDLVDTLSRPTDWRARFSATWSNANWRIGGAVTYLDDYWDTVSNPRRRVASWTTFDAHVSRSWLNFGPHFGSRTDEADERATELTLYVRNLFNENPPFVNNPIGIGFDAANASPVGRVVTLEVRRRW